MTSWSLVYGLFQPCSSVPQPVSTLPRVHLHTCNAQALASDMLLANLDEDVVDFMPTFDGSQVRCAPTMCCLSPLLSCCGLALSASHLHNPSAPAAPAAACWIP